MEIYGKNIVKKYDDVIALNGVSFKIPNNSVVGLVGHNGSGKTTLMEVISGLKRINKGTLSVIINNEHKEKLGVVLQQNAFYDDAKVIELLKLFQSFYKDTMNIDELIELTGINKFKNKLYRNLSGGMKQKVNIALALINKPELLILDEPTTGLDPLARKELWEIIKSYANEKTVIVSSHYMDEVEENCDQILFLKDGNVVENTSMVELKQRTSISLEDYYLQVNRKETLNEKCV